MLNIKKTVTSMGDIKRNGSNRGPSKGSNRETKRGEEAGDGWMKATEIWGGGGWVHKDE